MSKGRFFTIAAALLAAFVVGLLLYTQRFENLLCRAFDSSAQTAKVRDGSNEESPFACNLGALDQTHLIRKQTLGKQLRSQGNQIEELSDGYAIRFSSEEMNIQNAAEWITLERKCCPFFDFELTVERDNGSIWLKLRGREGIKEFIKGEFNL